MDDEYFDQVRRIQRKIDGSHQKYIKCSECGRRTINKYKYFKSIWRMGWNVGIGGWKIPHKYVHCPDCEEEVRKAYRT